MRKDERIETIKEDLKDVGHEAAERVKAGGEHMKRDLAGDDMNITEKVGSTVKEAAHNVAAETHHARRELRDTTEKQR